MKTAITPQLTDQLRTRIQQLPFADRCCLLVASILGRDREAFSAISGLAELVVQMSRLFAPTGKFRVAEILRSAADRIEHEHEHEHERDPQPPPTNPVASLLRQKRKAT